MTVIKTKLVMSVLGLWLIYNGVRGDREWIIQN